MTRANEEKRRSELAIRASAGHPHPSSAMTNTSNPPGSPWSEVEQHCRQHISLANELLKVVEVLRAVRVDRVTPIMSSISPSIILGCESSDLSAIKAKAKEIKTALKTDAPWERIVHADCWTLRLKLPSKISIDISTHIEAYQLIETEFE